MLITLKADIIAPTAPTIVATAISSAAITITLAVPSTDAGGLQEYVLERSTSSGGTYTEIARGLAILPYSDTGLTSSTAYFYRAKALDVSGNEGNYSGISTATTQGGVILSEIRSAWGHYLWIDTGSGGGGQAGEIAQITALASDTFMAGAKYSPDLADLEGATQGDYAAGEVKFDAYRNAAASSNKKLDVEIKFSYYGGSPTSASGKFPAYMATIQGGSPGYSLWDGVNPPSPSGSLVAVLNLWNAAVMDAYIAATVHYLTRHKDDETIGEWIFGETAIANLPGSGYSTANYIIQIKRWIDAARAAAPNTLIRVMTNYLDTSAQMQDLIAYCYSKRITVGGPDNYSRTYDSNPIYTGTVGGIDYRNLIPFSSESQYPASSSGGPSATSSQIFQHQFNGSLAGGGSTMPRKLVWFRNNFTNGGLYHTWSGETRPYIQSINGVCNKDDLPGYTTHFDFYIGPSGSDSNAGTRSSPWAITALATKASIYRGRRVGLLDGTYRFSSTPGISIPSTASGVTVGGVTFRTVIQAVNARQAILTNNSNGAGAYVQSGETTQCMLVNANYVDFVGLWINDCSGHGIVLQTVDNVRILNCKITDCRTARNTSGLSDTNHGGIYCFTQTIPKTNVTVRNCEIGDILRATNVIVGNNSNAIGDLFGAKGWIIEYNTVYRCGVLAYWKGQTGNHIVRNNFVYDCGGFVQGYAVEELSDVTTFNQIYNNIAICNFVGGPQSGNTHNGATLTEFYNNTIILKPIAGQSDTGFGTWTCPGGGSPAAVKLYNNLISIDSSMAGGFQELYSHSSQIAPRLRYTTNGGVRDYNSWSTFRVSDFIGGTSFNGAAGLTAIRLSSGGGWSCDAQTEIVTNFGFVNIAGLTPASFQLTGAGILAGTGKVGGISSGANRTRGAWDGVVTQIGKDW
jgi:hypothetical protein